MSAVAQSFGDVPVASRRRFWRPATLGLMLGFGTLLMLLAHMISVTGFVREDIAALMTGAAVRDGEWLSEAVRRLVGTIPWAEAQRPVLMLLTAGFGGALFAVLYDRLQRAGWTVPGAMLVVAALASHAGILHALTASALPVPLLLAMAAIVPSIRALEDVGDVQSAIGLSLALPLLLLAGPIGTLLVLPLAVGAAVANEDSRRDPRAFVAMLLVGLLPTLIVFTALVGFLMQAGASPWVAVAPYAHAFGFASDSGAGGYRLLGLLVFAPCLVVPLLYCLWPNLPERRHLVSALAVVALPLALAVATMVFAPSMSVMTPAVALLAAYVSWLSVGILPTALRVAAVATLALSSAMSWVAPGLWDDAPWRAALRLVASALVPV